MSTGARDFFKILTIDQPKGRPGLISKAEEEGKGKGKDNNVHCQRKVAIA